MIRLAINGRFLAQSTTGVQRVAREITREIDAIIAAGDSGFSASLICQPEASPEDLDLRAIKVVRVAGLSGHAWEQTSLPLAAAGQALLCLGNSAPVFSLLTSRCTAVVIHDLSYRLFPNAYRPLYRFGHSLLMPLMLHRAHPIITVSQTERLQLAALAGADGGRIVVAQNGGWRDTPAAPEHHADLPEAGYLLYVGALSHRKNLTGLLNAAERLAREDGLRLVIVGSTAMIHSQVSMDLPADVRDRILFLGHVEDHERLAEIYRRARCLVFPSFYEASPLPPMEAMSFGCPVVVSDIPSLRERCADAAEYCRAEDTDSIVAAIRRVVDDPVREADLVRRGRERAAQYSWRTQTNTILDAIRTAVDRS